jgi:hypothetical protein
MRIQFRAIVLVFVGLAIGCKSYKETETIELDAAPKQPEVSSPFVGDWNQRFELRPDPDRDEAEKKMQLKMTESKTATFHFAADGTFESVSLGFTNKGKWKSDDKTITLTVEEGPAVVGGKPYDFQLVLHDDGSLQGEENGYAWYLTRYEK